MEPVTRRIDVSVDPDRFLFHAADPRGNTVTMSLGGKVGLAQEGGFQARDLLLAALAGCSGASFLHEVKKHGGQIIRVAISVAGEVSDTAPRVFRKIRLAYKVRGKGLTEETLRRAALACHDDCSVSATLEHVAEIDVAFQLENAD